MKAFIGFRNIADFMNLLSDFLHRKGVESHKLLICPSTFYQENNVQSYIFSPMTSKHRIVNVCRKTFFRIRMAWFFFSNLSKFDYYIFFGYDSFLPARLDYLFLKLFRKRVTVFFQGSDVRYIPVHNQIAEFYSVPTLDLISDLTFLNAWWRCRLPEMLNFEVVSMRNQSTFARKPYFFFRFPQPRIRPESKKANKVPLIVHAPSNRGVKGTGYVLKAIEALKQEGLLFDFELIENASNDQVMGLLDKADIVVDEPSSWCARLSVESCASGCSVVGGNIPEYEDAPFESPIILFKKDVDYLKDTLRELITDQTFRQEQMQACYDFWQDYYSEEAFDLWFSELFSGEAGKVSVTEEWRNLSGEYLQSPWQKWILKLFG